jgi:hypothetical protein
MPTKIKKPTPAFVIRLVGTDLHFWNVPMRPLTRILNAVQRLIEHTEETDVSEVSETEEETVPRSTSSIQLMGVIAASAAYRVGAVDGTAAVKILSDTGKNLENPSDAEWDSSSLSSVEDISAAAKTIDCTVEIRRGDNKCGEVLAKITPQTYAQISESAFIKGESSIYGYLERVGGITKPHCGLRIATQPARQVVCHVASEELVRELGSCVYKNVRVSGEVTWFRKNWHIKTVDVQSFEPVKAGSIREALDAIYEAGGKAWDEIDDPEAVIKGVR